MSSQTGRFRCVVECRSLLKPAGVSVWLFRLECGSVGERPRQRREGGRIRPAPVRVRCRCPKCV